MAIDPREKVVIFIDGANLYATSKAIGIDIDYRRLLAEFSSKAYLLRAYYYTALVEDQEYSSIRPLIDWLDYNGFTVVTKPAKEFTDAAGRRKIMATWTLSCASMRWRCRRISIISCCFRAMATSRRWSRRCSGRASGSPWPQRYRRRPR